MSLIAAIGIDKRLRNTISPLLFVGCTMLLLYGSFRFDGVDFSNYRALYEESRKVFMPDIGYFIFQKAFSRTGLPFEIFMIIPVAISIFAYYRIAKVFNVQSGFVLFLYTGHLAIVRDFGQFRVGLAIAIFLIVYSYLKGRRISTFHLAYLIPLSIHITSAVLLAILIGWWFYKKGTYFNKLLPFLTIILIGQTIEFFSLFDPRIGLYLNWKESGYAGTVSSFSQLILISGLTLGYIFLVKRHTDDMKFIFFTIAVSVCIFFSFFHHSIFAIRLANVAMSFYPILILLILKNSRSYLSVGLFYFFICAYLFNPNTHRILGIVKTGWEVNLF